MEELQIKSGLLNIVDGMNQSVTSARELDLSQEDTYSYIERCLVKFLDDPALKKAEFREESLLCQRLRQGGSLEELAAFVVTRLDALMKNEAIIPPGDLLAGIVAVDGKDCLYLLKLGYRAGYTHSVHSDGGFFVDLVRHQALLPPAGSKADEGAVIALEDLTLQILEKPYALSDGRRCYFASDLLESRPSPSTKEILKVLDKAVAEANDTLNEPQPHIVPALKSALCQRAEQDEDVVLDDLLDEVFVENVNARLTAREELVKAGIPQTVRIRETQANRLSRQRISTDIGVELNLPLELYHDPNTIEFINNTDGTLSILIKGIGKLMDR